MALLFYVAVESFVWCRALPSLTFYGVFSNEFIHLHGIGVL